MRKIKNIAKTTTNNREYICALNLIENFCPICGLNKGCNKKESLSNDYKCWKTNRKHQWR